MCEAKDFPPSERDELMGLVTQLQGHVAQLTAAKEELHKQVAELKRAGKRAGEREPSVIRPWGEEAIEIPLRSDDEELFEALNAVRLPPRFTAIWHEDTREFEVIFTVLEKENRLLKKGFEFRYRGSSVHCSFGPSSPRLRAIARRARPSGTPSRSDYRNFLPFYRFEHTVEAHPDADYVKNGKPVSFWIRGIDGYDDDHIGDLVLNLNFHMSFSDQHTPTILIHEEPAASQKVDDLHPAPTHSLGER